MPGRPGSGLTYASAAASAVRADRAGPLRAAAPILIALVALAFLAPPAAARDAFKGKPRIVALEGFSFPTDQSAQRLRVGALVVTRYPRVLTGAFPQRVRRLLRVDAKAALKVFKGGERIATARDRGSLPLGIERGSLYFVHLMLFSQRGSDAILAAQREGRAAALDPNQLQGLAYTQEQLRRQQGQPALAQSSAQLSAPVAFPEQPAAPWVVGGCVIKPRTDCNRLTLTGADLRNADLTNANLSGAILRRAFLIRANLTGANLTNAKLTDAVLADANLTIANLRGADLTYAHLDEANLTNAHLRGAALVHADLTDAVLADANLTHANLYYARLTNANLTNANLSAANLTGARFDRAKFDNTRCPDGREVSSPDTC